MPRARKPPGPPAAGGYQPGADAGGGGGPPTLPPTAATGMAYGEHQQLIQAQQQIPLPGGGPAFPQQQPPPGGGPPAPGQGIAQAMQAAMQMRPPEGGLLAPSSRPHEPVTTGLPIGDGAGPEAIGASANPLADVLARIATSTGDQNLAALAERARALGGGR